MGRERDGDGTGGGWAHTPHRPPAVASAGQPRGVWRGALRMGAVQGGIGDGCTRGHLEDGASLPVLGAAIAPLLGAAPGAAPVSAPEQRRGALPGSCGAQCCSGTVTTRPGAAAAPPDPAAPCPKTAALLHACRPALNDCSLRSKSEAQCLKFATLYPITPCFVLAAPCLVLAAPCPRFAATVRCFLHASSAFTACGLCSVPPMGLPQVAAVPQRPSRDPQPHRHSEHSWLWTQLGGAPNAVGKSITSAHPHKWRSPSTWTTPGCCWQKGGLGHGSRAPAEGTAEHWVTPQSPSSAPRRSPSREKNTLIRNK